MVIFSLGIVSFFAWLISTLAGGGSPFMLIPLVNSIQGAASVPPIITIGMFLGNAHRIGLFWRYIDWKLTLWYAPGGILGAMLGAYTFTQIHIDWLQLLIGVFLVVSIFGFGLEQKETTFKVKAWYILPAGFVKAFVSGLIGTTGPVLNAFYLNYGLVKEELIATKATHVVIIHLVKILTYGAFGALSPQIIAIGLVIGLVAIPANFLGKYILNQINPQQFRSIVLATMAISGVWMLWGQRDLLVFW
ncbi:sulfite exporter TauE/SafE family protein [Scytonema hofmannii FACHB-248]|uniref:Probable membrane transporter protein n=1 Tax=Scytonema hofmannii FACHB-248 TaxID=1842502 RepID=A0ABR8GRM9_9CYAN|nr:MULTISPECIES: sulfite exporter TauE/SafE family protein [Nostocales]MBD2605896.1 sulfite exporter TauE/SafE family protein [Scytonema hofmannii FACHB-248]